MCKPGRFYWVWWPDLGLGAKPRYAVACLQYSSVEWVFLGGTSGDDHNRPRFFVVYIEAETATYFYKSGWFERRRTAPPAISHVEWEVEEDIFVDPVVFNTQVLPLALAFVGSQDLDASAT
jgi:hypothetical protein